MLEIVIVAIGILAFCLLSRRLDDSMVTPPMAFSAFGLVIGASGLELLTMSIAHSAIHILAEVTLVLVLFSDAARIDLRLLVRDHNLPQRLLLIGMPLTIVAGALVGLALPLNLSVTEAILLAAVLAPTDAALGQSVVANPNVPVRIRQALNVESGLNDGIAVPFVFLFAAIVAGHAEQTEATNVTGFAARQLIFGPVVGAIVGFAAARLITMATDRGLMGESFEGPGVLATAALAYAASSLIGGNGFIAAFVAGLVFGFSVVRRCQFLLEFAESEGHVLVLMTFLVFGAVMLPEIAHQLSWPIVLYAALSLTLVRMLPVALSLIGTGVSPTTVLFFGWFGPRGLASILFGLLVLEKLASPAAHTILLTTIVTVALSILLHGLTAAPLARAYARAAKAQADAPENVPVSEMPLRHPTGGTTMER